MLLPSLAHANKLANTFVASVFVILMMSSFLTSDTQAQEIWYELEQAELHKISIGNDVLGYSGTGYLTDITSEDSKATFTVTVDEEALYALYLGYRTPHGQKGFELTVNEETFTGTLPESGTFKNIPIGKVLLKAGDNTFVIHKGWGWYELDYVRISKTEIPVLEYPVDNLIDSLASQKTVNLFNYLKSIYGKKTLSGQQTLEDVAYIERITKHEPAIANIDLIEYSPSRIEHGSNPKSLVEKSISWAQKDNGNGIIGSSWHWNAPADLINTPGKEWWRGFYTEATTFNFAAALADTSSERYKLILRDIDAIAIQLQKFEEADIPVLWRPLHEASGGWFWWGAQDADSYIKLWRLLVVRLRDYHQLHNLIWVYTTGDKDWYPGDDWVDIIGHDIYTEKGASMSTQWEQTFDQFNGRKMVALSESGTLPYPKFSETHGTWWLWFSLWSGDFIRSIPSNELMDVVSHSLVVNRADLPDWSTATSTEIERIDKPNTTIRNYPNPFNPETTILLQLRHASAIKMKVMDSIGRQIGTTRTMNLGSGEHTLPFNGNNLSSGIYIVQIFDGEKWINHRISLIK